MRLFIDESKCLLSFVLKTAQTAHCAHFGRACSKLLVFKWKFKKIDSKGLQGKTTDTKALGFKHF